jgi:FtsP/CotA-like multicopper oxidase with cupredoxin domain
VARFSRRRALTSLLASAGATAAGLVHAGGPGTAVAAAADEMAAMAGMNHGSDAAREHSGHSGFTRGGAVDSAANGFDPSVIVRDFDAGTTSTLADGRTLREWRLVALDKEIEIAPGVRYAAWTFNGRVPGPTLRCTEGDRLRITFANGSAHPHTVHFHGIHPSAMDGVPGLGEDIGGGLIEPGASFTYEFDAEPFGLHLYHCHAAPLAAHIAKGLYGAFIVDPKEPRAAADELVMVMNAFDTNFDFANEVYAVNTVGFHYLNAPIRVKRDALVRIYLVNMLEYDPINSFHLHANFFHYFPTGTSLVPAEFTDTISQVQGQRGILELRFPYTGRYMFHAHKTEFAELGWMGFFEVAD